MPITPGEIQENLKNLKPEQLQKLQRFLTPGLATVAGVLFGDVAKQVLDQLANPAMQLIPAPTKAVQFLGEDKVNKFFETAALKADEAEQAQMAAAPQGGFAAPAQQPQAQQQAPVSPPAPTGFINQPQTPNTQSPITENALSTGNPTIA